MKTPLFDNKDFLAGLIYIVIASGAFYMARDYPFGSTLRMGPGYFPSVLSVILFCFGIYLIIRGFRRQDTVSGRWGWRPLILITIAISVFGFLMDRMGLVPALAGMFFTSAAGGHEFNLKEVTILTVVCTVMAWFIFILALGLPYQLFTPLGF